MKGRTRYARVPPRPKKQHQVACVRLACVWVPRPVPLPSTCPYPSPLLTCHPPLRRPLCDQPGPLLVFFSVSVFVSFFFCPRAVKLLNRLEINNQPVWGLTQEERELVRIAREKVNSC